MISALTAIRILFILGIVNAITGLLIFFSCRCLPGSRLGKGWMKYKWYQKFFKWHCYIWWAFWISVIIHAVFGIIYIGWPF